MKHLVLILIYENTDNFKSFKAKLLGNKVVQPSLNSANGILRNATIVVPLKYLSNFRGSLEMPLLSIIKI